MYIVVVIGERTSRYTVSHAYTYTHEIIAAMLNLGHLVQYMRTEFYSGTITRS